jgi:hypothetical protein
MGRHVGHVEQLGGPPPGGLGAAVVAGGGGGAGVAGHLLHDREIAAGVEQAPVQVRRRSWGVKGSVAASRASSQQRSAPPGH